MMSLAQQRRWRPRAYGMLTPKEATWSREARHPRAALQQPWLIVTGNLRL
jgi:hypothetical protein